MCLSDNRGREFIRHGCIPPIRDDKNIRSTFSIVVNFQEQARGNLSAVSVGECISTTNAVTLWHGDGLTSCFPHYWGIQVMRMFLKENKSGSLSQISLWTSPSRWSNISSITSRRPFLHDSILGVATRRSEERLLGTFCSVIEEEKSQQLSSSPLSGTHSYRFSSITDKRESNSISHISRLTSALSTQEQHDHDDVHSLSYSEKEWLKGVLNLSKRVHQLRSWIENVYEVKRRVWIDEHHGMYLIFY